MSNNKYNDKKTKQEKIEDCLMIVLALVILITNIYLLFTVI